MGRLFKEYDKRQVTSLGGFWRFIEDAERKGEEEKWFNTFPETAEKMFVPSCWNLKLGKLEYFGAAWYEREIDITSKNSLLEFEGVLSYAKVWLDGEYLGDHYGGYTAFSFLLENIEIGIHRLTVMVDNSADDATLPSDVADWYRYGGIIRDVKLHNLNNTYISKVHISYDLSDNLDSAEVLVKANISSLAGEREENITLKFGDSVVVEQSVTLGEEKTFEFKFSADNISLWDIDAPNLYTVKISTSDDDITDRIGFRKIETKENKIFLNGKSIFLKGVNRHEDHPEFGNAFPVSLMQRDLDIIKNLGCNTIRGSHYPNSKEFLDLLDENGILFWSEIPMWGEQNVETLNKPILLSRALYMHTEMVEQYFNHPSIIIWGMHNEIETTEQIAVTITEKIYNLLKGSDTSRLITYATDRAERDICFKYCDFISINKYFGWYGGGTDAWKGFFDELKVWFKEQGVSEKAVVMSEFGGAALYGNHTFDNIKWSEEYQANLLSESIDAFIESGMVCGTYVWHFADARTIRPVTDRARGFNNKGILNEYRKPKAAYFTVKEKYSKL